VYPLRQIPGYVAEPVKVNFITNLFMIEKLWVQLPVGSQSSGRRTAYR